MPRATLTSVVRAYARALAALGVGLGLLAPSPLAAAPGPNLQVHVFDIGQGSCVLVECPDDLPIVVDCGKKTWGSSVIPGGTLEAAGQKIEAILATYRAPGVRPLRVVISHPDEDHFALLPLASDGIKAADVGLFLYGGRVADFPTPMRAWINRVSQSLTGHSYVEGSCSTNARVSCFRPNENGFPTPRLSCGSAQVDILTANAFAFYTAHPTAGRAGLKSDANKNPDSAVVRVSHRGVSFIFTGDAQEVTQYFAAKNAAVAGAPLAGTSFLMASHHGARTHDSNDVEWIAATRPQAVIFSSHANAGYGHPPCEIVDRFDQARYPGGSEMTLLQAPVTVTCGYPGSPSKAYDHQFLATQGNGDISITVDEAGTLVRCERSNSAC